MAHVILLMATWNGAPYLNAQIESLRAQTHADWELWIRDDGSTDATVEIARAWAAREPRLTRVSAGSRRLGPTQGFADLLTSALREGSPQAYYFFCDQDDVWRADKIRLTLQRLQEAESRDGTRTPVAVHSDLAVVGPALEPRFASAKRHMGFPTDGQPAFRKLLAQNFVTGCTLAINRALAEAALPMPPEALMHDWWLALVASATGRLEYLDIVLIDYRQHGANASGATRRKSLAQGIREVLTQTKRFESLMQKRLRQSTALELRLARFPENPNFEFLGKFHRCLRRNRLLGAIAGLCGGIRMQGFSRTVAYYLFILKKGYPHD